MTGIVLQFCGISEWLNGNAHPCVFDPVTNLVGVGVFGLMLGAGLWLSLYFAAGGRSTAATVVCILVATMLFPALPGAYVGIAWSVLVVGAAAAVLQSFQKYAINPSTS